MSGEQAESDLEQLIDEFRRSGLRELHVRKDGVEIFLSQDVDAPGLNSPLVNIAMDKSTSSQPTVDCTLELDRAASLPEPADLPAGAVVVAAPYLGTFYRSPKPGQPPYVEIGQAVEAETELCLVEVMKLFTAVRSDTAGIIHAVLANDGEMVAANQPLFVIKIA